MTVSSDAPTVHFTTDSPTSTLRERGQIQFTCSVQGNPGPTSVVLTRGRDGETLGSVDTADQRAELTHILGPLSCVDTGVYVCSGQNSQGITRKKIKISVICEYNWSFVMRIISPKLLPSNRHLLIVTSVRCLL